jgi:preprotein translocase subunit SecF
MKDMRNTYVSAKETIDYTIRVLVYFTIAFLMAACGLVGFAHSWSYDALYPMVISVAIIVVSSIVIAIGIYRLYIQRKLSR